MLSESMKTIPAGRHSRDDEDEEEDDDEDDEDEDEDDDALSLLSEAPSLDAAEFTDSTDSATESLSMSWGSKDSRAARSILSRLATTARLQCRPSTMGTNTNQERREDEERRRAMSDDKDRRNGGIRELK